MSFVTDFTNDVMGKPDPDDTSAATNAQTNSLNQALQMAQGYYNQTQGIRDSLIGRLGNFMQGNLDPAASALYAPMKNAAEQQFQTGEQSLMSKMPAGGPIWDGLSSLYSQKADTISNLLSSIVTDEYTKAYGMGQGSPQVAASALQSGGSGANLLNALSNQQQTGIKTANQYGSLASYLTDTDEVGNSPLSSALFSLASYFI